MRTSTAARPGALCAAWEYADNGGSASLLLVRSVTYADFSPLQLISGGSHTLNMMSGVTLANNTNYINELIQLTSGTLRIESGNLSSAGKTAVRVVAGELEVCGGQHSRHRRCERHPGPQRGHGEHHRRADKP